MVYGEMCECFHTVSVGVKNVKSHKVWKWQSISMCRRCKGENAYTVKTVYINHSLYGGSLNGGPS